MKRTIITGATGFVGANLARHLLHKGHEVHLLVRPGYNPWRIESLKDVARLYQVSFSDGESLGRVVASIKPDWVFHLATYGAYSSQNEIKQAIETNLVGTINLVEACLKVGFESLVNTGSSSEYGFKDHPPSEQEWLEPNSYYALTKASATMYCRYIAQSHKVNIPTLRLYSVYGPYEEPTRLMPTLIVRGLQGELPSLVSPNIARDYIYSEDINEAYLLAATKVGQELGAVYNVGTGKQTTLAELVELACRVLPIKGDPQWGSMLDRQWDSTVWVANNQQIQQALGWQPHYSLEQGFRKMVRWFETNPTYHKFYISGK
jgi:nucleoside-diphosphate-sugar epimerase